MINFDHLECFLLFLGRGRSGSSLCCGLISCHPNVIIAHEKEFKDFTFKKEVELYNLLIESENKKRNIWKPMQDISVRKDMKDMKDYNNIKVIGTKKQGTLIKKVSDFSRLDELKKKISIPIKFINIYRNPFDNIATIFNKSQWGKHVRVGKNMKNIDRAITYYFGGIKMTQEVINRESTLNVKHEYLVSNPEKVLNDICKFLNISISNNYIDFCKGFIWKKPRQTRDSVEWSKENILRINELKNNYSFLKEYELEIK